MLSEFWRRPEHLAGDTFGDGEMADALQHMRSAVGANIQGTRLRPTLEASEHATCPICRQATYRGPMKSPGTQMLRQASQPASEATRSKSLLERGLDALTRDSADPEKH